jgi:hypothetical protein
MLHNGYGNNHSLPQDRKGRTGGTFLGLRTKPHLIYAYLNEAELAI